MPRGEVGLGLEKHDSAHSFLQLTIRRGRKASLLPLIPRPGLKKPAGGVVS